MSWIINCYRSIKELLQDLLILICLYDLLTKSSIKKFLLVTSNLTGWLSHIILAPFEISFWSTSEKFLRPKFPLDRQLSRQILRLYFIDRDILIWCLDKSIKNLLQNMNVRTYQQHTVQEMKEPVTFWKGDPKSSLWKSKMLVTIDRMISKIIPLRLIGMSYSLSHIHHQNTHTLSLRRAPCRGPGRGSGGPGHWLLTAAAHYTHSLPS